MVHTFFSGPIRLRAGAVRHHRKFVCEENGGKNRKDRGIQSQSGKNLTHSGTLQCICELRAYWSIPFLVSHEDSIEITV